MKQQELIKRLFESINSIKVTQFLEFLSDDVYFKFGNSEVVKGKADLSIVLEDFYKGINAISNNIINIWEQNEVLICQGVVTYTRLDNSTLSVPFVNILKLDSNKLICEYLIYADVSKL